MPQIADGGRDVAGRKRPQFLIAPPDAPGVGRFAEECPPQGGFAAGHRACDADDLPRLGGEGQTGEDWHTVPIGEREVRNDQGSPCRNFQRGQGILLPHQGADSLPGDLRLLHGVKQLPGLGGFDSQLSIAGEKGHQSGNVPFSRQNVLSSQPENEQHADIGDDQIQRRQGGLPEICQHGGALVFMEGVLIAVFLRRFTAVNPVGHGIFCPVEGGSAERGGGLFVGGAGALDVALHKLGTDVGHRRENQAQQGKPPVVSQQHSRIARHGDTGIKKFRGEFPHSLGAVVHIADGLGQQFPCAFAFQSGLLLPHQVGKEYALHPAAGVVGKPPHIKALDKPCALHQQGDGDVGQHQIHHGGSGFAAVQNVCKALCQFSFKPGAGQQSQVIGKAGQGNQQQIHPFQSEIGGDFVRLKLPGCVFHGNPSLFDHYTKCDRENQSTAAGMQDNRMSYKCVNASTIECTRSRA